MKKLLLGIVGSMLILGAASCGKSDNNPSENDQFKAPKDLSDSVSMYYGALSGMHIVRDINDLHKYKNIDVDREEFLKGIQMALAHADNQSMIYGMLVGSNVAQEINSFKDQGVEMNLNVVMKNMRYSVEADTFDYERLAFETSQMNALMRRAENLRQEFEDAKNPKMSPEEALEAGRQYIEKMKVIDPEIATTESGLSYKIIENGDSTQISDFSQVSVLYKGSLIDGTVFDQTENGPATFQPAGTIPGFAEGLKLLGKGGKAVLYIPGNLAYGQKGAGDIIGPNATLVFDVEIVDVK